MNYFYYVIGQKEDSGEINTPVKISESNNLYSVFSGMKNIIYIHQCKTQKSAVELADVWNKCAFDNGNYIYSSLFPARIIQYQEVDKMKYELKAKNNYDYFFISKNAKGYSKRYKACKKRYIHMQVICVIAPITTDQRTHDREKVKK